LARDIALAAGSRAHLSALKRNMVGPFRLEDAVDFQSIDLKSTEKGNVNIREALRPINPSLFEDLSLPYFFIDSKVKEGFVHGKPLEDLFNNEDLSVNADASAEAVGIFAQDSKDFLGFLGRRDGKWGYGHVFAGN
jgi:tRNA pseudouridine55 synthase